jgi:hypothetical protein
VHRGRLGCSRRRSRPRPPARPAADARLATAPARTPPLGSSRPRRHRSHARAGTRGPPMSMVPSYDGRTVEDHFEYVERADERPAGHGQDDQPPPTPPGEPHGQRGEDQEPGHGQARGGHNPGDVDTDAAAGDYQPVTTARSRASNGTQPTRASSPSGRRPEPPTSPPPRRLGLAPASAGSEAPYLGTSRMWSSPERTGRNAHTACY